MHPTPLHLASIAGSKKLTEDLLKARSDPNSPMENGITSLHLASQNGHSEVVSTLLNARADVNSTSKDGRTPLHLASKNGHLGIVKNLLEAKSAVNLTMKEESIAPLHLASQNGHLEVVKTLLNARADVNSTTKEGATPLHLASQNDSLKVVKTLLNAKADVNSTAKGGATPLHLASQNNHLKVVTALLQNKSDTNLSMEDGKTPLYLALKNGHLEVVTTLLNAKSDPTISATKDGITPLHLASQNGHLEIVKNLLEAKSDPNPKTKKEGIAPLHLASQNGHLEVVTTLLNAKSDLNLKTKEGGATSLSFASRKGNLEVVKTLLTKKDQISDFLSPILVAYHNDHFDVLKELFNHIDLMEVFKLGEYLLKNSPADSEKAYKFFETLFNALEEYDQKEFLTIRIKDKTILDCAIENKNYKIASLISGKNLSLMYANDFDYEKMKFSILLKALQNYSDEIEFFEFLKSIFGGEKLTPNQQREIEKLKLELPPEQQEKIDKALDEIDKSPPKVLNKVWQLFKDNNYKEFGTLILKEGLDICLSLKYENNNTSNKTLFQRLAEDNSNKCIDFLKRIIDWFRFAKNKDENLVFDFDLSADIKHKSNEQEDFPAQAGELKNITMGATTLYVAVSKQNLKAVELLSEYCDINHVTTSYNKNGIIVEYSLLDLAIARANSDKPINETNPKVKIIDHENSIDILKVLTGGDDGKGKKASLFRSIEHRKKIAKKFEDFKDDVKKLLEARYPDEIKLMRDEKKEADEKERKQKVEESPSAKVEKTGGEDKVEQSGFRLGGGTFVSLRSMSLVSEKDSSRLGLC